MKRSRVVICAISTLVLIMVGMRIAYINSNHETGYPIETFQMGEWVDLDGAFFGDSTENTKGYYIKVSSARLMTCDEYLDAYGKDGFNIEDGARDKTVIALEYEIRNESNDSGAILLYMHKLISARKNAYYECDTQLWSASQPQLQGAMGFALQQDSTYTIIVPFTLLRQPNYFDSYEEMRREVVKDDSFDLVLSNAPVQKIVEVKVSN